HRPSARRKDYIGTHQCQRSTEYLALRKRIRANHYAESAKRRRSHLQPIAQCIAILGYFQFINLAVMQQQLSLRPQQHRSVKNFSSSALDQTRAHVDATISRALRKPPARISRWNRIRHLRRAGVRPTQRQSLRQHHYLRSQLSRLLYPFHSARNI